MSLSLAKNVIVVGADNRPPMLDKTNYNSWASRMLLYIKGKEHGKLLVNSVLNGPFQYGTMVEPGNETIPATIRTRTYADLTDEEKIRESVDIKAKKHCFARNQATIQDGRVTVQTVQGRQTQGYDNNGARNTATNPGVNRQGAPVQARVVKCYNYQKEGAYLDPEQLAFLVDNGDTIVPAQASKEILTPSSFQTDDLDAFDSDCDDVSSTKEVLMVNLSSYDSDVLLEVPFHDTNIENDMSYQSVQETQCSEQPFVDNDTEIDITSDSNIISYEQYLQETKNPVVQNTISSAHQDELLTAVIEEMSSQVSKCNKV
ncbi:hypothetical protein Tco_0570372 [Tanacetum coccineum]